MTAGPEQKTSDGHDELTETQDRPSSSLRAHLDQEASQPLSQKISYKNNLLTAAAFLGLSNALDFPANVWNQVPVPLFATVLMGLGGSIAILWTVFALWDLVRSLRNIHFLWRERELLNKMRDQLSRSPRQKDRKRLTDAWLDVNFRELGWELVYRTIIDAVMGLSGILTGAGTLMAIRGDIPEVFRVSNLLSGYISNSLVVLCAVISAIFGAYMWLRARKHRSAIVQSKTVIDPVIQNRLHSYVKKHQLFAVINTLTVLISAAGSMVSATKWHGYVIIAPSIVGAVICTLLWRRAIGYERLSFVSWRGMQETDLQQKLTSVIAIHDTLRNNPSDSIDLKLVIPGEGRHSSERIVDFLRDHNLFKEFTNHLIQNEKCKNATRRVSIDLEKVLVRDSEAVARAAKSCIAGMGRQRFCDQERFLLEVYGCFISSETAGQRRTSPDRREGSVKNEKESIRTPKPTFRESKKPEHS